MYKVSVNFKSPVAQKTFVTKMPFVPRKGDSIGLWIERELVIAIVNSVVFKLDYNNHYSIVEVNVK